MRNVQLCLVIYIMSSRKLILIQYDKVFQIKYQAVKKLENFYFLIFNAWNNAKRIKNC